MSAAPRVAATFGAGAVFAAAAAAQRGLIFLLLPVYTHALEPAAYGRLSVLLGITAVGIILFGFGLDTAMFRTYFQLTEDPEARARFVATAWRFLLVVPAAAALVASAVAAPLAWGSDVVPAGELALALAGAAIYVSATVVPFTTLRAQERLKDYLVLTAVLGLTSATLTLVGVVVLDAGVAGWLGAVVVANAVTLALATRVVPYRRGVPGDRPLLRGALALGLPLLPHMLAHWGLGVSNRLILAGIATQAQVGVYALAVNVALPLAIAVQGLAQGVMPLYARAARERSAQDVLPRVINIQVLVVLVLTTTAALLGPLVVRLVAPALFVDATELVPWMAAAYGLLGLYFLPMNAVSLTAGRTGRVWLITLVAAVVNLVSLVVLEDALGLVGAAVAAVLGYAVLLVGVALYSREPDGPARYDWPRLARMAAVFGLAYAGAVLTSGDRTVADALVRTAWLASVVPGLLAARVIGPDQLRRAARMLSAALRR